MSKYWINKEILFNPNHKDKEKNVLKMSQFKLNLSLYRSQINLQFHLLLWKKKKKNFKSMVFVELKTF